MRDQLHVMEEPVVTPWGFKFAGNIAMAQGTFEPMEAELVRNILKDIDVMVDIGANVGFYTCLARSKGIYTIAVEPFMPNMDYLYANLCANGWNDVEVYPIGLASKPGLDNLYGAGTGASLLKGWAGASPLMRHTICATLATSGHNRFFLGL
ncbi:MAG: hypothetical protein KKI13_03405 [Candidatus Omnitrophica bacterium]|nr:hypothetical protein [Candidatus Omnitrophota bacterium]